MRYLIITSRNEPFLTDWFEHENHYDPEIYMLVFDLLKNKYTKDGVNWIEIEQDHL